MPLLNPVLGQLIDQLTEEAPLIPESRRKILDTFAAQIRNEQKLRNPIRLNFICTHNSRRSQIAQIWAHTAAAAFQVPRIETASGGTEATTFHPNAIQALRTLGFHIESDTADLQNENPLYTVSIGSGLPTLTCYSKRFEDCFPPDNPFIAVMTCSDADHNCPFVPGAKSRIPLTFEDPKRFDGTAEEQKEYLKTVLKIGRELVRVFRHI
ncbi:MAG: protein-tyrosine-phosphatase [Balneolales bacterium]